MKLFYLVLALLVASAVAITTTRRGSERYDIQPGAIASMAGKDAGHETFATNAKGKLPEDEKKLIDTDAIKRGVEYNDMPGEDGSTEGLIGFGVKFGLKETGGGKNGVFRTHYGCHQNWHAMGPFATMKGKTVVFSNKDVNELIEYDTQGWWIRALEAAVDFLYCNKLQICDGNVDVLRGSASHLKKAKGVTDNMSAGLSHGLNWIKQKIQTGTEQLASLTGTLDDQSDYIMAHILHVAQDSFANGHALRGRDTPDKCGTVALYMGYGMQEGNKWHGEVDHTPGGKNDKKKHNLARRKELEKCAQTATDELMAIWGKCKARIHKNFLATYKTAGVWKDSRNLMQALDKMGTVPKDNALGQIVQACDYPETWLKKWFRLMAGQGDRQAGGATRRSSGFYDEDPTKETAKLNAVTEPVQMRKIAVKYAPGEAFQDCDEKDQPKKGFCYVKIYEPKYGMAGLTHAHKAKTATDIGKTGLTAPEGVDFNFATHKMKYCKDQRTAKQHTYEKVLDKKIADMKAKFAKAKTTQM